MSKHQTPTPPTESGDRRIRRAENEQVAELRPGYAEHVRMAARQCAPGASTAAGLLARFRSRRAR